MYEEKDLITLLCKSIVRSLLESIVYKHGAHIARRILI